MCDIMRTYLARIHFKNGHSFPNCLCPNNSDVISATDPLPYKTPFPKSCGDEEEPTASPPPPIPRVKAETRTRSQVNTPVMVLKQSSV